MVNNLNAEALRNALVVASMEYCKKYLEGQNVDKTEDIKAQIAKLEANGLGKTKNAEALLKVLVNLEMKLPLLLVESRKRVLLV